MLAEPEPLTAPVRPLAPDIELVAPLMVPARPPLLLALPDPEEEADPASEPAPLAAPEAIAEAWAWAAAAAEVAAWAIPWAAALTLPVTEPASDCAWSVPIPWTPKPAFLLAEPEPVTLPARSVA